MIARREVEVDGPSLMHDFALTENHVIFFDSSARMLANWGRGFPFQWSTAHQARIGIIPRTGGATRWFEIRPGHLGHTINAFEHDQRIVLEGIRYEGLGAAPPAPHRWELELVSGRATEQPLDERPVEFPRIDDRRTGLAHRYSYVVEPRDEVDEVPTSALLRRYDRVTGTSLVHDFGRHQVAAECVFVPAHQNEGEDEGWLLSFVSDGQRGSSELVVLDARAFEAPPLARIELPQRVPFGFHGNWVPQQRSEEQK